MSDSRAVWAHGLRRLRMKRALAGDRQAVRAIGEALRDHDAIDLVGAYCVSASPAWGALGDGKLLEMLGKVAEFMLEHADEILALILKLVALKAEEDAALLALADAPPSPIESGGAIVGAVVLCFALLGGLLLLGGSAAGGEIGGAAVMATGEPVWEFVSPVSGQNVCVGPNCPRQPVRTMLDFVAPVAAAPVRVFAGVGSGSDGGGSYSRVTVVRSAPASYGSHGGGTGFGFRRRSARLWR